MTLPRGYRFAAGYAGIRKAQKNDIALIVSDKPAQAAAIFTQNIVQAAPVKLARQHLRSGRGTVAAILANAGNANCATRTGDKTALAACKAAGKALRVKREWILPASTGVIGVELDGRLLTDAIPQLVKDLAPENFEAVADAILTTDTRRKIASEQLPLRAGSVRVAGMTKGAGMIHPNMATTLGFVMTDAAVNARDLQAMLRESNARSYQSLTVDGDTSTNDTVALLANGASGVKPNAKERKVLGEVISSVMENLAEQIAADGEGARKLITVSVRGFRSNEEARRIARTIAVSPLVKTAIAGSDPNWGRILSAAGNAGVAFDPRKTSIDLQGVQVCKGGLAVDINEPEMMKKLDEPEVHIALKLNGSGEGEARCFTCDLTEGYVRINGSYRT